MVLQGQVSYQDDPMIISMRAMVTQMERFKIHSDNIASFGVPGYQRKDEIVTSFVEYLGPEAVDTVTSSDIGRIRLTGNPLDFALDTPGYFQKLNANGSIELSRDGRFQMDKNGFLLSLDNKKILSDSGVPIQFPFLPKDRAKQVQVSPQGEIVLLDSKTGKFSNLGHFGIASADGSPAPKVMVRQTYVEDSNVILQSEYTKIMPVRRQFEANRQIFIMHSDALSRMIQELGRTQ